MDINAAYREVGTYRGAADVCGTTRKTVKRLDHVSPTWTTRHSTTVGDVVSQSEDSTRQERLAASASPNLSPDEAAVPGKGTGYKLVRPTK